MRQLLLGLVLVPWVCFIPDLARAGWSAVNSEAAKWAFGGIFFAILAFVVGAVLVFGAVVEFIEDKKSKRGRYAKG